MHERLSKELEKTLYTSSEPNSSVHPCVIAFDKTHAVSFRHGDHSSLKIGDNVTLFNVIDSKLTVKTVVTSISDICDIIIFEVCGGEFECYAHANCNMYPGQSYEELGVGPSREPTWQDGCVSDRRQGYYIGTSHAKPGDSGSGIFTPVGQFLGIAVGKKNFAFADLNNLRLGEVADHHPDTKIIGTDVISLVSGNIGDDKDAPMSSSVPSLKQ